MIKEEIQKLNEGVWPDGQEAKLLKKHLNQLELKYLKYVVADTTKITTSLMSKRQMEELQYRLK